MNKTIQSFVWAAAIIAAAIAAKQAGLGDSESLVITLGLMAAALVTLRPAKRCGGC
ncbi:hypothetical protein [Sphingomicrobium astaxanthinifaciens]|uniref:hypothetical protein n=1 Tax=Sphingomicrobium astaxanthinifaciens TaxID=1227949 RepID=UPI001FCC1CF0|nr:hypothetical protein [Sphingomicrobium astaxanthinifaciens]MCJ7421337.1 hypothetical protein [Sphingomicrobium astaxanthinifaciens]